MPVRQFILALQRRMQNVFFPSRLAKYLDNKFVFFENIFASDIILNYLEKQLVFVMENVSPWLS